MKFPNEILRPNETPQECLARNRELLKTIPFPEKQEYMDQFIDNLFILRFNDLITDADIRQIVYNVIMDTGLSLKECIDLAIRYDDMYPLTNILDLFMNRQTGNLKMNPSLIIQDSEM